MAMQITVNDFTYTSIAAAWRALSPEDLPLITVRWRLKQGWDPETAFTVGPVAPEMRRIFKGLRGGIRK